MENLNILAAKPQGRYRTFSGTSMATPHVSTLTSLLSGPRDQKTQDAEAAAHIADIAEESGKPVEQALYDYHIQTDDSMFQLGMTPDQVSAEKAKKTADMHRIADILQVDITPDEALQFQQDQQNNLQALIRSLGGPRK